MNDDTIHEQINALVDEEHQLRAQREAGEIDAAAEKARLTEIETERDRLWDLLRQREAKRDAGQNPDEASERPAETVEKYLS